MKDQKIHQKINDLIVECATKRITVVIATKEEGEEPSIAGCGHTFTLMGIAAYVFDYARNKLRVAKAEDFTP